MAIITSDHVVVNGRQLIANLVGTIVQVQFQYTGPENWGMIEELAELLGAATACSKPVSDMDWRPHSEHVGQTGITIKPNSYIA